MEKLTFLGKKKKQYYNILVDLPHGLGDQLMCLPLFKSLKKKYPDTRITVFTPNGSSASLLNLFPYIDNHKSIEIRFSFLGIIAFFLKNYIPLRRFIAINQFDLYLAPQYNFFRIIFAKVFSFPSAILGRGYIHKIQSIENVLNYLDVEVDYDYSLKQIPESDVLQRFGLKNQGYVVLDLYPQHLNNDPRKWFYFEELISSLKNDNYDVVTVGLNEGHIENDNVVDLVNKTSFVELLSVLAGAKLVVALDSGIFHFSYCLETPVIGLFGPVDPADRRPTSVGNVHVIYKNIPCSPCIINKVDIECGNQEFLYSCMKAIRPEEVMKKIRDVLKNEN